MQIVVRSAMLKHTKPTSRLVGRLLQVEGVRSAVATSSVTLQWRGGTNVNSTGQSSFVLILKWIHVRFSVLCEMKEIEMPCDTRISEEQIKEALKKLRQQLIDRSASVVIGANGSFAIKGWRGRDGMSDVCAYRRMSRDMEMRTAIARAEQRTGNKLSIQTINAGVHSHDGGRTWSKH
jgi:hypothetical protein